MALEFIGIMALMTYEARATVTILDFNDHQITANVAYSLLEDGFILLSASGNFRITVGENDTPGLSRRGTVGRITLTAADNSPFDLISFYSRSTNSYVVNGFANGLIIASQAVPMSSTGTAITLTSDFNRVSSVEFLIANNSETSLDNIHVGPPASIPEPSPIVLGALAAMTAFMRRRPSHRLFP